MSTIPNNGLGALPPAAEQKKIELIVGSTLAEADPARAPAGSLWRLDVRMTGPQAEAKLRLLPTETALQGLDAAMQQEDLANNPFPILVCVAGERNGQQGKWVIVATHYGRLRTGAQA